MGPQSSSMPTFPTGWRSGWSRQARCRSRTQSGSLIRVFTDAEGLPSRRNVMPLPQDIRPAFQGLQDTLVRSDSPWIEQSPLSSVKVLWVGRESGCWASLHHWKKGYVARPHKHLAGGHAYVISGKLQVRDDVLNAGDYTYEPAGTCTMRRLLWRIPSICSSGRGQSFTSPAT